MIPEMVHSIQFHVLTLLMLIYNKLTKLLGTLFCLQVMIIKVVISFCGPRGLESPFSTR